MRLSIKAMAGTSGIFWGVCVLFVGIANNIWSSYGLALLQLCASIYPGYHPGAGLGSVVVGAMYALVDGLIGGAVFGWLYNLLIGE